MIFVTVGTHEQGFERLIEKVDSLVKNKIIKEKVFIQKGYTKYIPKYCSCKSMISYKEMIEYVKKAKIVITHGGPGSIIIPWKFNKIPIVVPRNPKFNEHVDEHQILFSKRLEALKKIIAIYNIDDIDKAIVDYENICQKMNIDFKTNTANFTKKIEDIADNLKVR